MKAPDALAACQAQADAIAADNVTISNLASLSAIEYDRQREQAAQALGVRVGTLDAEVQRMRGDQATDGQGHAITFEVIDPWPNAVNGADLLDRLADLARNHLVLPEHGPELAALWTVLSWFADAVRVLPILAVTSPEKGCGKTTVLEYLRRVCHRAQPTSNVSAAALFRFVEKHQPTLLIDEGDSFLRDNEELRGILNSGHTRTSAYVIRTAGDDHEPRRFSTWCPKAIAAIGRLPDTIADRSVELRMRRKAPGETVQRWQDDSPAELELRRRLARWSQDHAVEVARADPVLPAAVGNRQADNWRILLAIADACGGSWPEAARVACQAMTIEADDDSIKTGLLADVRAIFADRREDKLPTEDLIAALIAMPERPWTECSRGKPITSRQLARWLKDFGVRSRDIRPTGQANCKGYRLTDLQDAFTRYLPPDHPRQRDNPTAMRVPAVFDPRHEAEVVTDEISPRASNGAGCHGVTDKNPGSEARAGVTVRI